jgi:hypothetical protein
MLKRYLVAILIGLTLMTQYGCAPLAAGAAGAAIGAGAERHHDRHDNDRD